MEPTITMSELDIITCAGGALITLACIMALGLMNMFAQKND